MSYVSKEYPAQPRSFPRSVSYQRTVVCIGFISWWCWLLHSISNNSVIQVCASTVSSPTRLPNNDAEVKERYEPLVTDQSTTVMMEQHHVDLPIIQSPNSTPRSPQSEAITFDFQMRRTQENAACSANPGCMGLADDCCPTSAGEFLGCCELTTPPVPTPTVAPIPPPTDSPIQPTNTPISLTVAPTTTPVRPPTTAPSASPVRPPTLVPTLLPVITTNNPTVTRTIPPLSDAPITESPVTLVPILPATQAPLLLPTNIPSFSPTPISTSRPTIMTTAVASDSAVPSYTPSAFFQYRITTLSVLDVQLTLRSESSATRRKLQSNDENGSNCTMILQNLLTENMENEIDSIINVYESLHVEIQNFTAPNTTSTVRTYIYDVLMDIRSPMEEHDANRYVEGSLLSQVQKNVFIEELKATDCPEFQYLSDVTIAVPRASEEKSPDSSSSNLSMGFVAGIVAGGAVLMMLIGAIFIGSRIRKRNRQLDDDDSSPIPPAPKRPIRNGDEYHMSSIEISTLGDPIVSERGKKSDIEDSTIGSANIEYDYRKAFGDVQSMTDSQLAESSDGSSPNRRSHRFGSLDDPSLQNSGGVAGSSNSDIQTAAGDTTIGSPFYVSEEQFDVVAPVGLLGLILETSLEDGRPMVFSIKPSSSLAHVLKVGDRLIAVDGTDVSNIRASDVSRMIAEKKDRTRQLVFSRLVKGNLIPNKRY